MPAGLVRDDLNITGDSFRNGNPVPATNPSYNSNPIPQTNPNWNSNPVPISDPTLNSNPVTWAPTPAHFGNVILLQAATPTFSPGSGSYSAIQTVTITSAGATIYYTTDGSTPDNTKTLYTGPITVSSSETVKAIAYKSGLTPSDIGSATYTLTLGPSLVASVGGIGTTAAIDTTGANFLVAVTGQRNAATGISDSKGNTWYAAPVGANPWGQQLWYCYNATVGAGHTFSSAEMVVVEAWSGMNATSAVYESAAAPAYQNVPGSYPYLTTYATSTVTPASTGDLIISMLGGYFAYPDSGWAGVTAMTNGFTSPAFCVNSDDYSAAQAIAHKVAVSGDLGGVSSTYSYYASGGTWYNLTACFKKA